MKATEQITRDQFIELFDQYVEKEMKAVSIPINSENKRSFELGVLRSVVQFFITDEQRTMILSSLGMITEEYQVIEFTETDAITGRVVFTTDTKYRAERYAEQYGQEMGVKMTVATKIVKK